MFRREVFYCILCIVVLLLVTVNVKHTAFKQQWVAIQEMALKNFSRFILFFCAFFIIMVFLLVVSIGRKEKKNTKIIRITLVVCDNGLRCSF